VTRRPWRRRLRRIRNWFRSATTPNLWVHPPARVVGSATAQQPLEDLTVNVVEVAGLSHWPEDQSRAFPMHGPAGVRRFTPYRRNGGRFV
jgi:hypothetical protein